MDLCLHCWGDLQCLLCILTAYVWSSMFLGLFYLLSVFLVICPKCFLINKQASSFCLFCRPAAGVVITPSPVWCDITLFLCVYLRFCGEQWTSWGLETGANAEKHQFWGPGWGSGGVWIEVRLRLGFGLGCPQWMSMLSPSKDSCVNLCVNMCACHFINEDNCSTSGQLHCSQKL